MASRVNLPPGMNKGLTGSLEMPTHGGSMKACIVDSSLRISPFGEPAHQLPVLGEPLSAIQARVLEDCGLSLVDSPPSDEPYLIVGSRTWFTPRLLRRFLERANGAERPRGGQPAPGARLRVEHQSFQRLTEPLQRLPAPGVHELALLPAGASPSFGELPCVTLHLELSSSPSPDLHPGLASAGMDELVQGDEMVYQLDHWIHLQHINVLAMAAWGHEQRRLYVEGPLLPRLWRWMELLARARSLDPFRIAGSLVYRGSGCVVHPSATVEASALGAGVIVGPNAVVRGCLVGDGCRIDDHASVAFSVLGREVRLTHGAEVNLSTLMDGALVSRCGGLQASVVGREAFVAQHAIIMDRTFEQEVRVLDRGERVGSGRAFLGVALGHRARVGAGVVLGYGTELPNDATAVLSADRILRTWPDDQELLRQ
jgi:carbonic anhydrase/acetyltransferase-like protein (isoleucine patch superfamily)